MKKITLYLIMILCFTVAFTSCEDDKNEVPQVTIPISLIAPEEVEDAVISGVVATVKNITTGKETEIPADQVSARSAASFNFTITVDEGFYNITVEGDIAYTFHEQQVSSKVRAYKENVSLTQQGSIASLTMEGFLHNEATEATGDFVIAEIFFTGTLTPEGKQYVGDSYFRIYNNSSDTLYADGLIIAESKFNTVRKYDYRPDIMSTDFAINAMYRVPGNGKEHPVLPGKSILICDNAIDHTQANQNSFNLMKADFEWYDVSTKPTITDVNNPDVPDMDKIYASTLTIWSPHNRGFCSYVLARMEEGMDKDTYLRDYTYHYEYDMVLPSGTYTMNGDCYRIPNNWVLDAVNCSIESNFVWLLTSPSLDLGWTHCGTVDMDKTRYGKSVRRKVATTTANGRKILKDTNNSTVDFDAEVQADPYYEF